MSNHIEVFQKEVSPIIEETQKMIIEDAVGMKAAVELLSRLNQFNDRIVEEKEKITVPLEQALKAERARWKPIEAEIKPAIDIVRGKMSDYQTAEIKRARDEEARIAARVGEGKGKLKVETAVKKFSEIERADKKVATDAGMVKFREDKKLKIMDESLIPREYLIVDERKVLADLKAGKSVMGAILETVQTPVNFR